MSLEDIAIGECPLCRSLWLMPTKSHCTCSVPPRLLEVRQLGAGARIDADGTLRRSGQSFARVPVQLAKDPRSGA